MPANPERISYLLDRYTRGEATAAEIIELFGWIKESEEDGALKSHIYQLWNNYIPRADEAFPDWEEIYSAILNQRPDVPDVPHVTEDRRGILRGRFRLTAAAAILILLATGSYRLFVNKPVNVAAARHPPARDIVPGHSGAVLTLSDGRKITLDSAGNGMLADDAHIAVVKKNGEITYTGKTGEMVYNDVTTARGRQWRLTLSDGTRVWLNALSSIHYPVAFTGKERVVEITGEAYFEVAHRPGIPFRVKTAGLVIEDIGTHFNVNAYADEPAVKTTLVEGSVAVSHGLSRVLIKPGEQALLANGGAVIRVSPVDTDGVVAWKNGLFELTNAGVPDIMRQVSRWYDVQIAYDGEVPQGTISGEVSRNLNLSEILKVLILSGVHCTVEGNTVRVSR